MTWIRPTVLSTRLVAVPAAVAVIAVTATAAAAGARTAVDPAAAPMTAAAHDHRTHDHGAPQHGHRDRIVSPRDHHKVAAFDLVTTSVHRHGDRIVFTEQVRGRAGTVKPEAVGRFAASSVYSYVWPTSLNPSTVGFTAASGVLALAATSHPDFDDTPLADENRNGGTGDDGALWHAHWVVLVPDTTRPDGALKVRDIVPGEQPQLPGTWPGAPIYLDSPGYPTKLTGRCVRVEVPMAALGFPETFRYDGVTAALKVNGDLHDPLLRVENVFDVASGDLSLPGTFRR